MKTKDITQIGLFAAIITALSLIPPIPLPFTVVPITMQTLGVFLAGSILGTKKGFMSVLVYICLGAIGLPVFAGFRGGFSIIIGPTGGYIIGFALGAFVIGWLTEKIVPQSTLTYILGMLCGILVIYALGTFQLAKVTGMSLQRAFEVGSLPFIPLDILKAFIATIVVVPIKKRITL